MKRTITKGFILALGCVALLTRIAGATPSTHIWSPSTDVQPYGVFHLTYDTYIPVKKDVNGNRPGTVANLGLTAGVLPYEKVNMEVGFDSITNGSSLDDYPFYINAKVGTPEDGIAKGIPAIAFGVYGVGTKTGGEARAGEVPKEGTDLNVYYGKIAKTIGPLGKFSAGYYQGNEKLLVDENGKKDNSGILLCWERTMSEISDNLWVAVDYQGGNNSLGALSYGLSWKFAPNTSVIFGYVDQNNDKLAGVADSFTVQLDIDFDVFNKKK